MFGSQPRIPRPVLLILVYGAFLVLVGITATAQSVLVSAHFSASALNDVVGSDAATTRAFVNAYVQPRFLASGGLTGQDLVRLDEQLETLVRPGEIVLVELRRTDGTIVASSNAPAVGSRVGSTPDLALAASGSARAAILDAPAAETGLSTPGSLNAPTLLREYLPISADGQVRGIVAIWRDAAPILARLDDVRRSVVLVTLSCGFVAAALLFLVFRAAQSRLTRQTTALVESTRIDPLTGTLNHGALVGHLAAALETARTVSAPLGVALIDVDNFRLLNDNHGHRAGDEALLAVAGSLRARLPEGVVVGRYGPDEFLLIASAADVADLEPIIDRVRAALADLSLQFEASERLPITVSTGLCTYPDHGSSVTVLLATAARTLEEAKASGGDAVRVAGTVRDESPASTGFDVLQGLVFAVDTKDRYTKVHSEDVARYAVYLAGKLSIDPDLVRSIHVAGLLHDVGKIGIPDRILRKPGTLTTEEYEVVKQHVALGDMIVRDVPDIEIVRAGIRHHHERWDGAGYLDRLAGEEIPLIARVLAVGDAFSAMTTTRPYRKALSVEEALKRLEDAAGTQLDERLVVAFVGGIRSDDDPPHPTTGTSSATLWAPVSRVA